MSEELPEHTDVSTRFQRFKLLLWKSYLWHRHYWWWTIMEIFFRVSIPVYLIFSTPNNIRLRSVEMRNASVHSRLELLNTSSEFSYLAYTPSVSFTDKLMENVVATLKDELGNSSKIELVKMANEKELEVYAVNNSFEFEEAPLGVVFLELTSDDAVPNKLKYKIRQSQATYTNWVLLPGGESRFAESPYWTDGFSAIQLVLNEEFTKMKLNSSSWSAPEPIFQQFPYPEYEISDVERDSLLYFVCASFICIEIAFSVSFIASVIREKRSGAEELMKVYGVEKSLIWMSWFIIEFVVIFVWVTVSTIILKIPFKGNASEAVRYIKFSVLWTLLMLFCISNVSLSLFICTVFNRATVASVIYVFLNFISVILTYVTQGLNMRRTSLISCVIPATNLLKSMRFLLDSEVFGFELDWTMVKNSRDTESTITFIVHFAFFLLDFIIYSLLALKIGLDRDEFGEPIHSPMMIFQSFYRRFRKEPVAESVQKVNTTGSLSMVYDSSKDEDDIMGDFPPINPELTIQVENLHKEYGSVRVLNGIDVQFYDHEIGVVLGHKGAGKTTLLSILAGRIPYNRGSIHYKGVDINDDNNLMKNNMGICFEENRLFNYVSVLNHLVFYGMLKGLSRSSATDEAEHYLMKMEMQDDEKSKIDSLSESTKRKLSIAISFMGDRQILLLDKPMIGLDLEAKTVVWNFLMGMRIDHTIVLTSNYEKEAERMADRITILENGSIVAHGTPKSLKKNIGMHYEIAVAGREANFGAITETVHRHVEASVQHETEIETIYHVPITESSKFPKLFENLENNDFGISEINVVSNSIEHNLIKSGSVSADDSSFHPNTHEVLESDDLLHKDSTNGFRVRLRQTKILFWKKLSYVIRDYKNTFGRIILPTLVALLITVVIERLNFDPFFALKMSPTTSLIYPSILIQTTNSIELVNKSLTSSIDPEKVPIITINSSANIHESLLNLGMKDLMLYRRELFAAFKFENDNRHLILYNPVPIHTLPVAISIYSNTLLKNVTKDDSLEIIAYNHPVPFWPTEDSCFQNELWIQVFIVMIVLFVMFGYYTVEIVLYLFELSNIEMSNSLMHLQIMSGVPVWIYWFTTIVFDLIFFILVVTIRILLFRFLDNYHEFFKFEFNFGVFISLIIISGITGLFYAYVVSFLYNPEERNYAPLFVFNFTCNLIVAMAFTLIPYPWSTVKNTFKRYSWLTYAFLLFPFLNFPWALTQYSYHWYNNNECSLTCSRQLKPYCEMLEEQVGNNSVLAFSNPENEYAILLEMIFLVINLILSILIFLLMNFGLVDFVHNFFRSEKRSQNYDEDVKHERSEIFHVKEDSRLNQVPLLVDGLSKNYIQRLKPVTAVEDVSFMADHGTCFGILKGHQAGKSTVFDMMTAKTIPTKGDVSVEGIEMSSNKKQYFSMVGYCPQTSPLLDKFTGREMLMLIAALSGDKNGNENLVSEWISASGLNDLQNVKCEYYTDGNKRLLSTILALIGYPKVVYLDEPASGVDFTSRRHLYDIIEQVKNSNRTVVLGSPSAIECYILCDRLTILKNGIMNCLGHPHDLRKHYDLGYFIVIKVQSDVMSMREVGLLEEYMIHEFGSKPSFLIEQYRGLLQYQITDPSLRLSVLFKKMESIKENNSIVEEYTVRTTTLEDIFEYFSR